MNKIKIKTIELPQFIGKPIQDVYDYVKETYPEQLAYDGVDFYDNEVLKDGNYHFFFGSVFRHSSGRWDVPCVRWFGGSFGRRGDWLGAWYGDYRVVLLDKIEGKKYKYSTRSCWNAMKDRCDNPENKRYAQYGGRGISYCKEWEIFGRFMDDMGEKPDGLSLDRINNDGNYCKDNCRWATSKEQANNRSDTILYQGECAKDASIRLGGGENLVLQRIQAGWTFEEAFTTILTGNKSHKTTTLTLESLDLRVKALEAKKQTI